MRARLYRHTADLLVGLRVLFIPASIILFNTEKPRWCITGMILLITAALFDWMDGFIARRLRISSELGSLLDTLGDRITENLLMLFFVYKQLIPLPAGVIFLMRAFLADFVRTVNFKHGIGTFAVNRSRLGRILVASPFSRMSYLLLKMTLFLLCARALYIESGDALIRAFSWLVVTAACVRFLALVYDSREIFKQHY
ncbi:MAG: CDP-alcohol phosphatidyltransferase family protein [Candidatus Omnitrophica bacterium]|nr:CDP-alcohol phosphatidyltransferase family protein [Candidatus Omnitrophota bacterium]